MLSGFVRVADTYIVYMYISIPTYAQTYVCAYVGVELPVEV